MTEEKPYFGESYEYEVDPDFEPAYLNADQDPPSLQVEPGVLIRPVMGRHMNMNFVHFEPNSVAPVHQHGEEQLGTVVDGSLEFELAGEKRLLRKGDVYVIPPNVPHGAATNEEPCLVIDVFSPPRAGLRELIERQGKE
jgi:quercetin dioxygenase-like cupin family protein